MWLTLMWIQNKFKFSLNVASFSLLKEQIDILGNVPNPHCMYYVMLDARGN